jgi:hypothetical protein
LLRHRSIVSAKNKGDAKAHEQFTYDLKDAIALMRQMLWGDSGVTHPFEPLEIDGPLSAELGVGAFLEKRKPAFPGKVSKNMPAGYKPPH